MLHRAQCQGGEVVTKMEHSKPLAIDLFCGLGGWTEGLLAENYFVIGFDTERHRYGDAKYPAQLVLQDVLTLHGRQFKDACLIVASPPCQGYSYRAMPWKRAKALPPPDNSLFDACFRIQREAIEAAGHFIPLVVENVRGAQKWVGRSRWNFGSFHLWGDVPALMPMARRQAKMPGCSLDRNATSTWGPHHSGAVESAIKNNGGSWFAIGSPGQKELNRNPVHELTGQKTIGHANIRDGYSHTRHLTNPTESEGVKFSQSGAAWFDGQPRDKMLGDKGPAALGSKSNARKSASAMIAKIPLPLAQYIAQVYKGAAMSGSK